MLDLERKQWTEEQAADTATFRARIEAHPDLCTGAFCVRTGELSASLFLKPTDNAEWINPGNWAQSADLTAQARKDQGRQRKSMRSIFGISLTSVDSGAAAQIVAFNYLYLLKRGYREIFLGSPMPGLKRYLQRHPDASPEAYARATKSGLPIDPQLRYYHGKGWREIVAVRAEYFPHEASGNYGAILKSRIPFRHLALLFRFVPVPALRMMAALAPRFVLPDTDTAPTARPTATAT